MDRDKDRDSDRGRESDARALDVVVGGEEI